MRLIGYTITFFLSLKLSAQTTVIPVNSNSDNKIIISTTASYATRFSRTPEWMRELASELPHGFGEEQKDYLDKLRKGISFDFSAYYKFDDFSGVGIKYNIYKSSSSAENIKAFGYQNNLIYSTNVSDDITIMYIGPAYMFDVEAGTGSVTIEASAGYMKYKNVSFIGQEYHLSGSTIGTVISLNYKLQPIKNFYIGPQITLAGGTTSVEGVTSFFGYKKRHDENLWRFDLGFNFSYRI